MKGTGAFDGFALRLAALVRAACVLATLLARPGYSRAEDQVSVVASPGGAAIVRSGTIADYNGHELRMTIASGRTVVIPAAQVAGIETERSAIHADADRLFVARQWQTALAKYQEAIGAEPRAWLRREVFAQIVWCYRHLRQGDAAGKFFLRIAADATDLQYGAIPLAWQPADPLVVTPEQARQWLQTENDAVANLLGASHLLTTGDAATATTALTRLTVDRDARVALLAEAQLWRAAQATLAVETVEKRRAAVERLPVALRAGPYFALGQSLAAAKQTDGAIATLMRVPIGYPAERQLSAAALGEAIELLTRTGREAEAKVLRDELAATKQ